MTENKPAARKDHNPEYKLSLIMQKTIKVGSCLEWTGNYFKRYGHRARLKNSEWQYPYMYYKNKVWRGNRLVMFLIHGSIPENKCVLHKCDNMKCINPKHLYFGTLKDNKNDAIKRKRAHTFKIGGKYAKQQ